MRADAPGKLVISGAYAVLCGAPALVTAVDLRVRADGNRPADYDSREVFEGLALLAKNGQLPQAPWYDASALRRNSEKLGLGSSAAICVASLGIRLAEQLADEGHEISTEFVRKKLYPLARRAHQLAQGGGSGIDVAAACFGGTLAAQLDRDDRSKAPHIEPARIPSQLRCEVWASHTQAETKDMVQKVLGAKSGSPSAFQRAMGHQIAASHEALEASRANSAPEFTRALRHQLDALHQLGELSGVVVVAPELRVLAKKADDKSCFLPSGAGGGDVNLYFGPEPSSQLFRAEATRMGLTSVNVSVAAEGLRLHADLDQ